jgi:hypothetical protein
MVVNQEEALQEVLKAIITITKRTGDSGIIQDGAGEFLAACSKLVDSFNNMH